MPRVIVLVVAPVVIALTPWLAGALKQEAWTLYMWVGFGGCFGAFAAAFINERGREKKQQSRNISPRHQKPLPVR